MKIKSLSLAAILSISLLNAFADEGLWIPVLLERYNIDIMQKEGLKLSAEGIFTVLTRLH